MKTILIINVLGSITQCLEGANELITSLAFAIQVSTSLYVILKDRRK